MSDQEAADLTPDEHVEALCKNELETAADLLQEKHFKSKESEGSSSTPKEKFIKRHSGRRSERQGFSDRFEVQENMTENNSSETVSAKKTKLEIKDEPRKTPVSTPSSFLCSPSSQSMPQFSAASYLQGLGFSAYPSLFDPAGANNPFLQSAFGFTSGCQTDAFKAQESLLLKSLGGPAVSMADNTGNVSLSNGTTTGSNTTTGRTSAKIDKHNKDRSSLPSAGLTVLNLSAVEVATLRALVSGYREAAALLLKSAEELENIVDASARK